MNTEFFISGNFIWTEKLGIKDAGGSVARCLPRVRVARMVALTPHMQASPASLVAQKAIANEAWESVGW
jgi:hypothetical protein